MVFDVGAFDCFVSAFVNGSILLNVIVITDITPLVMVDVVIAALLEGIAMVDFGSATMDYD